MSWLNSLVMYIHILAGIGWLGSIFYLRFLLLPALMRTPPTVRGPVIMEVGPRSVPIILRLAEVTIASGIVNVALAGRVTRMEHFFTSTWGWAIFAGLVGTLVIYIIGQAVTRPATLRVAEIARASMAGQAPPDAPALLEALATRQRQALNVQAALGALVVLEMAIARFS